MHLTITVNFPDGTEHDEIEASCADLADMPSAVASVLLQHKYVTYSSLVIVVVPEGEAAASPKPALKEVA